MAICDDYLSRHPDIRERQSAVMHYPSPRFIKRTNCSILLLLNCNKLQVSPSGRGEGTGVTNLCSSTTNLRSFKAYSPENRNLRLVYFIKPQHIFVRSCTENLKRLSSSTAALDTGDCLDKTFRQLKVKLNVKVKFKKSPTLKKRTSIRAHRWRHLG